MRHTKKWRPVLTNPRYYAVGYDAATMAARLLYRDAQGRSGEVTLSTSEPTYIGRALECAVRTDDAMVSRKHTLVRREDGGFVVEDLGSSNGTHVNDVKVERLALKHNDVVRCGNLWLRYIEDGDDGQPKGTDPGPGPSGPSPKPSPVPRPANDSAAPRERRGSTPAPTMAQGSDSAPPVGGAGAEQVVATGLPGDPPKRQAKADAVGPATVERSRAETAAADERLRQAHQRAAALERSLFQMQREFNAVQQQLTDLLVSVTELKDLTSGD